MGGMRRDDFDYELPQELIAQFPPAERGASRLLHLDGVTGACKDRMFRELPGLVDRGDVVVLNETRASSVASKPAVVSRSWSSASWAQTKCSRRWV